MKMADDDIWDSWEDFADSSDLDKHVDQHLRMTNGSPNDDHNEMNMQQYKEESPTPDPFENARSSAGQFRILPRPVVHEDDVNRTAYAPQVKILRRPGQDSGSVTADKDKQKSQPSRTLAEREAAYAEARKRIMGPVSQSNSANGNNKSRTDNRRSKNSKQDNNQNNTVRTERLPKGPDKAGKGFNYPR